MVRICFVSWCSKYWLPILCAVFFVRDTLVTRHVETLAALCCAHLCAFLCMLDSTRRQVEVAGMRRMQDVAIDASHRCLV